MEIPKQLQNKEIRFVLLGKWDDIEYDKNNKPKYKGKAPFESAWQTNGYEFFNPRLTMHIAQGMNFGVIGGYGRLRILDIDEPKLAEEFEKKINTYTVKTGSGGRHFYFFSDYDKNHVLINQLGELRANKYQVVSAPSKHPTGNLYTIINDSSILEISADDLLKLIEPYLRKEEVGIKINETGKDTSRSGLEYREVLKRIGQGKNKEEIYTEMEAFAKWATAPEQYKEKTYEKAKAYSESQKDIEPAETIFGRLGQAKSFHKKNPFAFDKAGLFWIWDTEEKCYKQSDKTDILNNIRKVLNVDTIESKARSEIVASLEQIGRERLPKEVPSHWIQFKKNVVDIKTGEEFEASPDYFFTSPIPWDVGESEDTPMIDKLFKEWMIKDGIQDESWVNTLQEVSAYATEDSAFMQTIIWLCGSGCNGKGCYLNFIMKFLGEKNVCASELKTLVTRNFETSGLYKKKAVVMGEVDTYDLTNTNLLKQLSGEDLIRFEFKGKTPFSQKSTTTCFIASNALPVTPDRSNGFYRRNLVIDFPNVFKVGKDIVGNIPEIEYKNFAKKSIRLLKELHEKGYFTNGGTIEDRKVRYEERSNPIVHFITMNCTESPEDYQIFSVFLHKFQEYLKEIRLRPMSSIQTSKALKNEGYDVRARHIIKNGEDIHTSCIFGLKIIEKP